MNLKKARYWHQRRVRRKALGICVRCGQPDAETMKGRAECAACLLRRKLWRCLK